jgi:hypothetical protein
MLFEAGSELIRMLIKAKPGIGSPLHCLAMLTFSNQQVAVTLPPSSPHRGLPGKLNFS